MIYHCGHLGCDICGARECAGVKMNKLGIDPTYEICDSCLLTAVKFAVHAAETFGGTFINPREQCANKVKDMSTGERNPSEPYNKLWDICEHSWRARDSQSENEVECTKCKCPGDLNRETGKVYWPAT